jgi:hypothetical protein
MEEEMIGHCFNSKCRTELQYLRQGSVYLWEKGRGRAFHSEFFWLCPACTKAFTVAFDGDRIPSLVLRGSMQDVPPAGIRIRRVFREMLHEEAAVAA